MEEETVRSYFPDPRELSPEETDALLNKYPPVITRRLTQEQLHQLVAKLLTRLELSEKIDVVTTDPAGMTVFEKMNNGLKVSSEADLLDLNKTLPSVKEAVSLLDNLPIEIIAYHKTSPQTRLTEKYLVIYENPYPFFRSPEQKQVLKDYLSDFSFDYPSTKMSEKDYLVGLEKENQQLRSVLTSYLPKELNNLVVSYQPSPKQITRRHFIESRFPEPGMSLIGQYLGLDSKQY